MDSDRRQSEQRQWRGIAQLLAQMGNLVQAQSSVDRLHARGGNWLTITTEGHRAERELARLGEIVQSEISRVQREILEEEMRQRYADTREPARARVAV